MHVGKVPWKECGLTYDTSNVDNAYDCYKGWTHAVLRLEVKARLLTNLKKTMANVTYVSPNLGIEK